jgi:uncharacterized protein (UPF0548 family)
MYIDSALTYGEVGATRGRELPRGYAHTTRRVQLGSGTETFERASTALLQWDMHRRSGLAVAADGPALPGRTVVLGLGVGLALVIPCRVVYVVDEHRRRGFAYGTLSGHPEEGEEAFLVTRDEGDQVWLDIVAFSRPGTILARLSGPLGRAAQSIATARYQRALLSLVSAP